MRLKFLIIGRTASGKDFIANKISAMGLSILKSYTTRPQRNKEDINHIFITEDDFKKIQKDEIAAYTEINGYKYFSKREQITDHDIYVIDPVGAKELMQTMPDELFVILYIKPKSKELQKEHFIKRSGQSEQTAEKQFNERYAAEDDQFKELDDILEHKNFKALSKSNFELHGVYNYYDEWSMNSIVDIINKRIIAHRTLTNLINHVVDNNTKYQNILDINDKGRIKIYVEKQNTDERIIRTIDPEKFATVLFADTSLLGKFMIDLIERGFSFN